MITRKQLVIVGVIAGIVFLSITIFRAATKDAATQYMQVQIDTILKKMECPNNECDRYKGKDAKRDFAAVNQRIDELERRCANGTTER